MLKEISKGCLIGRPFFPTRKSRSLHAETSRSFQKSPDPRDPIPFLLGRHFIVTPRNPKSPLHPKLADTLPLIVPRSLSGRNNHPLVNDLKKYL